MQEGAFPFIALMSLSEEQKLRYSRNIALPQIGSEGQESLLDAKALVVGAGGLGAPLLMYLAAAGVGKIGIIDSDRVELSNLQRQIIYNQSSIGHHKSEESSIRISAINPDVDVTNYKEKLTKSNASDLITNYDIIADCSDNFTTRFLINEQCHLLHKTLISGAVVGFEGQVATFKSYGINQPCYRCFCPQIPNEDKLPNCSNGGIIGAAAGVIGSLQATEIIKEITDSGNSLAGSITIYNALNSSFRKVKINKKSTCPTCS